MDTDKNLKRLSASIRVYLRLIFCFNGNTVTMKLDNRLAFITGGGRGIGRAIALAFAREGANVAVAARTLTQVKNVAQEIKTQFGLESLALECDVRNSGSVKDCFDQLRLQFGRGPDIVVNNAGIAETQLFVKSDEEMWERHLNTNLGGTFRCTHAALPEMIERGWGRIINIASIAGKEGNPNAAPYSAAKAGVIALTKSLGKELAQTGVRVNCVTPAAVTTAIFDQITEQHIQYMLSKIPLGRFGTVEEMAAMIAWLASEECSFSTGAVFDLSGGRATY